MHLSSRLSWTFTTHTLFFYAFLLWSKTQTCHSSSLNGNWLHTFNILHGHNVHNFHSTVKLWTTSVLRNYLPTVWVILTCETVSLVNVSIHISDYFRDSITTQLSRSSPSLQWWDQWPLNFPQYLSTGTLLLSGSHSPESVTSTGVRLSQSPYL